jgi:hypothetical protein
MVGYMYRCYLGYHTVSFRRYGTVKVKKFSPTHVTEIVG